MSVKIRLKKFGAKKRPYYRIVVADSRCARDGATLEEVGYYRPVEKENQVSLNTVSIRAWLDKGAIPSPTVKQLLNKNNFFLG
ncbi:MAG: 30S ribosomal protein S16 [Spirochaetes bacterium GWB1_48_6]|nr:MAG: 30S ribosomal protein S16 [Spirochaetes bacterium GWB1_48_6]